RHSFRPFARRSPRSRPTRRPPEARDLVNPRIRQTGGRLCRRYSGRPPYSRELTARGETPAAFGATLDFHHGLSKLCYISQLSCTWAEPYQSASRRVPPVSDRDRFA